MIRTALVPLGVALGLIGCKADTGLIVAVSGQTVEELEFQVALNRGDQYVIDASVSSERRPVAGRDLTSHPYELLLREEATAEDASPPTVRVLVLGYQAGKLGAFALMEPPQVMLRGELLRRTLVLAPIGSPAAAGPTGKGCYAAQVSGKVYVLVADDDRDCDGYRPADTPADCSDADATVNPGAREVCDGKDDNCDGRYAPPTELCYSKDTGGVCREGSRACTEGPGGGGLGPDCPVSEGSPAAKGLQCLVYEGCFKQTAPLLCLSSRLPTQTYACTIELVEEKGTCAGSRDLQPPFTGKGCVWSLVDAAGLPISLQPPTSGCATKIVVAAGSSSTSGMLQLEYQDPENKRGAFVAVQVSGKQVKACSSQPFSCTKK